MQNGVPQKKPGYLNKMCPFLAQAAIARATPGEEPKLLPCQGNACALFCTDTNDPNDGACAIAMIPIVSAQAADHLGRVLAAHPAQKSALVRG